MSKRISCLILTLCLLLGMAPPRVRAAVVASETCGDNVTWTLDDGGTLTISGSGAMADYPDNENVPWYNLRYNITTAVIQSGVTSIGSYAFRDCRQLTSVAIPDSVISIGDHSFDDCGLTGVTIPNSVTSIGDYAFCDSDDFTTITIPSSVTSIGEYVFLNCNGLTGIYVDSGNAQYSSENGVLFNKNKSVLVQYPPAKPETTYEIPNSVISINRGAFEASGNLISLTIPNSVTSIGHGIGVFCGNLTALNVASDNAQYSSENGVLFNKNKSVLICYPAGKTETTYTIPDTVASIEDSAFYNCNFLSNAVISNSVTSIGDWAFAECANLNNVTIPNSVTSIGEYAFLGCKALTSVTILNGVTTIGPVVFMDCDALTSITIPNSVTSIGDTAFRVSDDEELVASQDYHVYYGGTQAQWKAISIAESNDLLLYYATIHCTDGVLSGNNTPDPTLTPDNATYLVEFDENGGSGQMNAVTVRGNTYTLPENGFMPPYGMRFRAWRVEYDNVSGTFEYYPNATIPVTSDLTVTALWEKDTTPMAQGYCGAAGDGTNLMWSLSRDWNLTISGAGDMASYDTDNRAPWYGYHTNITTATLQSGVTKLGSNAFTYCAALESVSLPDTLVTIEEGAFLNCAALESVNLPSGLLILGNRAFYGCESLGSVTIPASVADTGDYTFENCSALSTVNLPASLTRIGYYTFYNCDNLKKIAIPQNVSVLNTGAFADCDSLREVTFPEALTRIADGVFENCKALEYASRDVRYLGTVEQFGAVALTLGANNDPLKAQVVHCADGDYDWTPPDPYRILDKLSDMYGFSDQIWRLAGALFDFQELRIGDADGTFEPLTPVNVLTRTGLDYLAEEGSTKLTIPAETFQHFGYGSHTIAADFRNAANTETGGVETRDQIYTVFPPDKTARIDSTELYGVNGVEKVSYTGRFRSVPALEDGLFRFQVVSGQTPPGLNLRDGGYFTGAAKVAGTYIFTVGLQLKRGGVWPSDYEDTEQVVIVIEPGTEENVQDASDPGYEIVIKAEDQVVESETDALSFTFVSMGPYEEFRELYIDGDLVPKSNYEASPYNVEDLPRMFDQGQITQIAVENYRRKVDSGNHVISDLVANAVFIKRDDLNNEKVNVATQTVKVKQKVKQPAKNSGGSGGSTSSPTSYAITKAETTNGSIKLNKAGATYGEKVTITATPDKGYQVGDVKVTASNGKAVAVSVSKGKYTFTMPSRRVTVSATFTPGTGGTPTSTDSTYTVNLGPSPNGAVKLSASAAAPGDTVTLSAVPDKGYLLLSVDARDAKGAAVSTRPIGNDSYIFSMPYSGVTVKANFGPKYLGTFKDILGPYWFFDDAEWAYNRGILRGVTDEYWEPESKVSGVTSIVTLERLDGVDLTPYDTGALDGLDNSKWYVSVLRWARVNGICNSYRAFSEYEPLTRGEYAVILYNFLRYRGLNVTSDNDITYTDAAALTETERKAFQFLQYAGVFHGYEDGAIRPDETLNRAQLASLLHRLSQYIIRAETVSL